MKRIIKYAILKYIPNLERNEKINIAVILHYPTEEQLKMIITKNWKRIKNFDDEADIQFLKKYVEDIKKQITQNLFNESDGINLNDMYLLDEFTKYFVNKFIFEIHEINTNSSFRELLENLKKIYLYYDTTKDKRISEKESKAFIEQHFLENNISYERRCSNNIVQEEYGNNINFDYKIANVYYKIIFLTQDNYNSYIAILKMWIANYIMLKKDNKELVFVIDDNLNNDKTKNYKKMLSDYCKVITIQEFINIKVNDKNKE